jgi:carboxylesterase
MKKYLVLSVLIITAVIYMNSGRPLHELKPFTDLTEVDDAELLDLDFKKSESEDVKLEANYPQFHKGGDVGVLIMHGFTASPLEMQPIVDFLIEHGFSVYQVRTAGHGSIPEHLNLTTYQDWYESARYGYFVLKRNCKKVFTLGESMGGAMALTISAHNDTDGAILLAPCIKIRSNLTRFSPILSKFVKLIPKVAAKAWTDDVKGVYYEQWPVVGIYQLLMYTNYLKENMDLFSFPMLGFQFPNDAVVSGKATREFFENAPSDDKTYVEFPDKLSLTHILVSKKNVYRDEMFTKIAEWLNERGVKDDQ